MANEKVYSGQMNRRVSFYKDVNAKNAQGESINTPTFLSTRFAERIDAVGNDDTDGKLLSLAVCRYRMRFDGVIAANASALTIKDFDGDWDVVGPVSLLGGRKRYMELKCRKRGESFTL